MLEVKEFNYKDPPVACVLIVLNQILMNFGVDIHSHSCLPGFSSHLTPNHPSNLALLIFGVQPHVCTMQLSRRFHPGFWSTEFL